MPRIELLPPLPVPLLLACFCPVALASRALYEREGFFVLRNLFSPAELASLRANVLTHLSSHDALHSTSMGGVTQGGWYVADFPRYPELQHVLPLLASKQKLNDALTDVLRGSFRVLSRNEIYIDRWNVWHFDGQHGAYGLYEAQLIPELAERRPEAPWTLCGNRSSLKAPPDVQPCHAASVAWRTLPNGEQQKIATLAVYLEDHAARDDVQALTVKPRTHAAKEANLEKLARAIAAQKRVSELGIPDTAEEDVVLHPNLGDAVIFDARLLHRGQERRFAALSTAASSSTTRSHRQPRIDSQSRNLSAAAPHRIALSVTFARPNAFAEAFERGFGLRNRVTSRKVCKGGGLECVARIAAKELRRRPLNVHAIPTTANTNVADSRILADSRPRIVTPVAIPYVTLSTGARMPRLAIGTGTHSAAVREASGGSRVRDASKAKFVAARSAVATLNASLSLGYTHVETSEVYPGFDELHHVLSSVPRPSYFLTAKVDPTKGEARQTACAADGSGCASMVVDASKALVQRLAVDHVDLLLLHRPPKLDKSGAMIRGKTRSRRAADAESAQCARARAQWRGMEALARAGIAKAIGVSNYCAKLLTCVLTTAAVTPAVWQQMHHLGMGADPYGYISWARRLGIQYMAYSVLGGVEGDLGRITGDKVVLSIASRRGTSAADVALRWVAQQGLPLIVLSRSAAHLQANLHLFDDGSVSTSNGGGGALTAAEMLTLSAIKQPAGRPSHWGSCRDEVPPPGARSAPSAPWSAPSATSGPRRLAQDDDLVRPDQLRAGRWTQKGAAHLYTTTKASMPRFYASGASKWDASLLQLLSSLVRPDRDVYQFGVYTGTTLKLIGEKLPGVKTIWAFDSFEGFPEEVRSAHGGLRMKGWGVGRDSASDALGIHSTRALIHRLRQLLGRGVSNRTTFIQGYYNESLTDALARRHPFQPALLVDLDCDLYVSTMDAFKWLMRHKLLVPLTLVRYDDFGTTPSNASSHSQEQQHTMMSPQALAHEHATRAWGLEWRPLGAARSARAFQLLRIEKPDMSR